MIKINSKHGLIVLGLAYIAGFVAMGCGNTEASRQPTKSEVDDANRRRQADVDKMNLPDSVKEQMKAHMGGPPASSTPGERPKQG